MKIQVTVTRKALVDPDIAKEIAQGFLEYLDYAGQLDGLGATPGPSYEELAERYIKRLTDPEYDTAVLSSLHPVDG